VGRVALWGLPSLQKADTPIKVTVGGMLEQKYKESFARTTWAPCIEGFIKAMSWHSNAQFGTECTPKQMVVVYCHQQSACTSKGKMVIKTMCRDILPDFEKHLQRQSLHPGR
jgi:hypothetical protein